MNTPQVTVPETNLAWTSSIQGKEYRDLYEDIKNRPIVAWFSNQKRAVHQLCKATARVGDNLWILTGHNYDDEQEVLVTLGPTELHKALRYLTQVNGWTMCEFRNGYDFHKAVLTYIE